MNMDNDISKKESLLKWTESEKGNFSTFNSGASRKYKEAVNCLEATLTNIVPLEKKIKIFIKTIKEEGVKLGRNMDALDNEEEFLKNQEKSIDKKQVVADKLKKLLDTVNEAAESERNSTKTMEETKRIKQKIAGVDISSLTTVSIDTVEKKELSFIQ